MDRTVSLPMDLLETLEQHLHAGMDSTKLFEVAPGFSVAFRTLTGEEEIECRTSAAEFRGPAYIYTYKTKVLSNVLCQLNDIKLPPSATIKMPKKRTDDLGRVEEILTDVPLASHLEGIILTWSKGLIDICFKLWSKHQEEQLYKYIAPFNQDDLFTVEEKMLAKEYEQLLNENNSATAAMTPSELVVAVQNTTPGSDLVKIGAQVTKHVDPHIDFSEEAEEK